MNIAYKKIEQFQTYFHVLQHFISKLAVLKNLLKY